MAHQVATVDDEGPRVAAASANNAKGGARLVHLLRCEQLGQGQGMYAEVSRMTLTDKGAEGVYSQLRPSRPTSRTGHGSRWTLEICGGFEGVGMMLLGQMKGMWLDLAGVNGHSTSTLVHVTLVHPRPTRVAMAV